MNSILYVCFLYTLHVKIVITSLDNTPYRTLIDFNYELLCPLPMDDEKTDATINHITNTNNNDSNNTQNRINFLNHLFKIQFPQQCDLSNNKFYIFNSPCHESGLFATLRCWVFYLSHALSEQRTFIMLNGYKMFDDKKICKNKIQECFFLPMTNCTIKNITKLIEHAKKTNQYCLDYEQERYKNAMTSLSKDLNDSRISKLFQQNDNNSPKKLNLNQRETKARITELINDKNAPKCLNPIFDNRKKKKRRLSSIKW